MNIELSHLPLREQKPRTKGLTVLEDTGESLLAVEQQLQTASHCIDFVRFTPQSFVSQQSIQQRIQLYTSHAITPFVSGLLFEAAYLRSSVDQYLQTLQSLGITCIEISDGTIEIPFTEKAQIIQQCSTKFDVIAKIGAAKKEYKFHTDNWRLYIDSALQSGAKHIMIEGGEAGASQLINGTLQINEILAHGISKYAPAESLIWEAPEIAQQLWLLNQHGSTVNIAGIQSHKILETETVRQGLSIHTLLQYLPPQLSVGKVREFDTIYNFDWQI
ncbi:MAG TPA: phosphosulfolactate synthase [Bacteroidales bacterium]|nr:MAG: Phosphosulfolactate synthase [Bacteroidetes bacterium ADurb.Bin217]HPH15911.1 phosphosulfolactate synthase [Bacteroidales bacterium]HPM12325.1 phosphosulfolactate synthase [Bacteroidales bacterium]